MEKEQPAGRKNLGETLFGVFVLTFKSEGKNTGFDYYPRRMIRVKWNTVG